MLNRRHAVAGFSVLVLTGTALLVGATLTQAVGMLMLGTAIAWLAGSRSVLNAFQLIGRLYNRLLPWLFIAFAFVFASFLLIIISLLTNFSYQFVICGLLLFGLFISPFSVLIVRRPVLRVIAWIALFAVFFIATVGFSQMDSRAAENTEAVGGLMVSGFCAVLIGMYWLVKGKTLLLRGLDPVPQPQKEPADAEQIAEVSEFQNSKLNTGTIGNYLLLIIGFLILSAWAGVHIVLAVGDLISPIAPTAKNLGFLQAAFLMLLAWWPYAAWKKILSLEPNFISSNVRRHRRITTAAGITFVFIISVASVFAVQRGTERRLALDLKRDADDFWKTAADIGNIKGRGPKTIDDYIAAYGEIALLEDSFDNKLQKFEEAWQAQKSYRGPLGFLQPVAPDAPPDETSQTIELWKELGAVTRKLIGVTNQLKLSSKSEQLDLWREQFVPLAYEHDSIRSKLIASSGASK